MKSLEYFLYLLRVLELNGNLGWKIRSVNLIQLDLGRRDEPCRQNGVLIWSTGFVATTIAGHTETLAVF